MRKVLVILGQLSDSDVEWMSRAGNRRRVADNADLIVQGEPNSSLFIVLDGTLDVVDSGIGTIASLECGEIIGEMSFVDNAPPSAGVVSRGESVVLELGHGQLEDRMRHDPAFGMRLYKALSFFLADRLRGTVRRLGYGDQEQNLDSSEILEDELDENILDSLSLAGGRFERLLKTLSGVR